MKFAVLEGEKITNIIELEPHVAYVFPDSVAVPENISAGIGDTYRDGRFYRENPETHEKEEILPYDPMAVYAQQLLEQKLAVDQLTVNTDYRLLMLEFGSMA